MLFHDVLKSVERDSDELVSCDAHIILFTYFDRLTGEEIPLLIQLLMEQGAKNVHIIPALGKKGRATYLALIDFIETSYENIANVLIYQFSITGWHIVNGQHQRIATVNEHLDLNFSLAGHQIAVEVFYKCLPYKNDFLIILENDHCIDLLRRLKDNHGILISAKALKNKLRASIRKAMTSTIKNESSKHSLNTDKLIANEHI